MLRLFAILSMIAFATGCGPTFYERCLLGVSSSESGAGRSFTIGRSLVEGDVLGPDRAHEYLGYTEAYCAELDARRRAR